MTPEDADLLPLLRITDPAELMEKLLQCAADFYANTGEMQMEDFAEHRWTLLRDFAGDSSGRWTALERINSIRELRDKGIIRREEMTQLILEAQNAA